MSANGSTQPHLPIFKGNNYHLWSLKMKTLLRSQELWDLVENGFDEQGRENRIRENQKKDAKALFFIQQSLDDELFPRIVAASTSKEAWEILQKEFIGDKKGIKKPKLFWVSVGAPLVSVIMSTILVFAFKGQNHGISIIGKLQEGLNPPSWYMLQFHGAYLGLVIKTGIVTGIISLTEGIAVGRTFAALRNYKIDGNKEMIAIGMMNIVGSSTSCYVTSGGFSRSAVNNNAGAKTAVSNIVMAITVMVTLLLLMPLFQYTPNVVLGAIIVTAVVGLIDLPAAYHIWKVDKFDFVVTLSAFFGVVFISVQIGLAIAVGLSVFKILLQITRPKTVVLGNIPGSHLYRDMNHYEETVGVSGFLILSVEAPINFANVTYLVERISRWLDDFKQDQEDIIKAGANLSYVILEMSAVSSVDTSGVSFLAELGRNMENKGIKLVLVNPLGEVMEKLRRADEGQYLTKSGHVFLTVQDAVSCLAPTISNGETQV